jgi:hypothetical protein
MAAEIVQNTAKMRPIIFHEMFTSSPASTLGHPPTDMLDCDFLLADKGTTVIACSSP